MGPLVGAMASEVPVLVALEALALTDEIFEEMELATSLEALESSEDRELTSPLAEACAELREALSEVMVMPPDMEPCGNVLA